MKKYGVFWMICLILLLVPAGVVYARESKISQTSSISFKVAEDGETYYVYKDGDWAAFASVVSSNVNVAAVECSHDGDFFWVEAVKNGTCTITVSDEDGKKKDIAVSITKAYVSERLAYETLISNGSYGTKEITIETRPYCSGTMKIGKDTYKVSTGRYGEKTIKVKRRYKLNEKILLNLKWKGISYKFKDKIRSSTHSWTVKKVKKSLKVQVNNLHKGDVIIVKHKGKVYKKKIPKDYAGDYKYFLFRVKKPISSTGDKVVVKIKNKAGQKLDSYTYVLKKGFAEVEEDDLDD